MKSCPTVVLTLTKSRVERYRESDVSRSNNVIVFGCVAARRSADPSILNSVIRIICTPTGSGAAKPCGDEFRQQRAFRPGDLDHAVHRCGKDGVRQRLGHVGGGHRLHRGRA